MNEISGPVLNRDPVAIIAGNGQLPVEIAEQLQADNTRLFIVAIKGEAHASVERFPHEWCEWERIGRMFRLIKEQKITRIVLAGGVIGRPEIKFTKLDWGGIRTLPGLLAALLEGDNAILSGVIAAIEKQGLEVCNIAEILPQLTVSSGANTSAKPKKPDLQRIAEGVAVTRALGRFDIGQGCVVVGGRAVAVEGAEGTDSMLQRISAMRASGRLPKRRGGVLVKSVKPGQDERADLPAIGPDTILSVSEAGLAGIGVQAGKTLIIDRAKTLRLAKQHNVFIYGYDETGREQDERSA